MAYLGYPAAKSLHTNLWQNIKVPNQSKSRMRSLPTCWAFHEGCSIIKKKKKQQSLALRESGQYWLLRWPWGDDDDDDDDDDDSDDSDSDYD